MSKDGGYEGHWHPAFRPDTRAGLEIAGVDPVADKSNSSFDRDKPPISGSSNNLLKEPKTVVATVLHLPQESIILPTTSTKGKETTVDSRGIERGSFEPLASDNQPLPWSTKNGGDTAPDYEEISSDEDTERLDPAWGLKRLNYARTLESVHRSNTFPDFAREDNSAIVLPTTQLDSPAEESHAASFPVTQLPATQAEDRMQEMEAPPTVRAPTWRRTSRQFSEDSLDFEASPVDSKFTDPSEPFDEGEPLIVPSAALELKGESDKPRGIEDMFSTLLDDEDASFFGINDNTPANTQQPPLERKTTSDIFDAMHFSSNDPLDSPTQEKIDILQSDYQKDATGSFKNTIDEKDDGEKDVAAMWDAVLDDEEFLVEDPDDLLPDSTPASPSSFLQSLKEDHALLTEPDEVLSRFDSRSTHGGSASAPTDHVSDFARQSSHKPYTPHQPSTSDLTQLSPTTYGNIGLSRPGLAPMNSFQQQLQRPGPAPQTKSFADQTKGGYKSPYDLPLEISKSKKRPQMLQQPPVVKSIAPPPRHGSNTSFDKQLQSPFSPSASSFPSLQKAQTAQDGPPSRNTSGSVPPPNIPVARPSSAAFFEELPVLARPRPPTASSRYTPQPNQPMPPPQLLPQTLPPRPGPPPDLSASPERASDPYAQYQLRPPERLDPYANIPLQPVQLVGSTTGVRYSPAPTSTHVGPRPGPSARYSPAPAAQPARPQANSRYSPQSGPVPSPLNSIPISSRYPSQTVMSASPAPSPAASLPFQPRTSSPLAYHEKLNSQSPLQNSYTPEAEASPPRSRYLPQQNHPRPLQDTVATAPAVVSTVVPPPQSAPQQAIYEVDPPRRSQTQSPGKWGFNPSIAMSVMEGMARPATAHAPSVPATAPLPAQVSPEARPSVRQRGLTQNLSFIEPTDGLQYDNLGRWKGAPIFHFGFGGTLVSSFPKHVPRYAAGAGLPMIKPAAGEVLLRNVNDVLSASDHIAKFPGPLRSKSKKKDVLSWLSERINLLEQLPPMPWLSQQLPDPQKRHDEKILLWKILKAMVENDGLLEGNTEVQQAANRVLTPEVYALDDTTATQYRGDLTGIYRPMGTAALADAVNPVAVESVRKLLIRGEREKAVWAAVDNRLWAHAMLISSTLDKSVWKQVVQEFVRQEVKVIGANTESLAALYEVFAGNIDESIDELVPPSARAGLQMVSKVDTNGPAKNALDGLDRWRETLGLILNNRSADDSQALAALGRLLSSYGRVESAHICFLFARSSKNPAIFGGSDDPQSSIVLLGADHHANPLEYFHDEDAILLTEVYEFATSVLAGSSASALMPHVQVFKLHRAKLLAETGHKSEAQAYCEAVTASLNSTTKISRGYSPSFFAELEELSNRLKQVPVQSSSSWMAKPSIEKISGSVWNKLSSFVAGEESDAESTPSGREANYEHGPFANVTGTPSLSRSGSQSDLYGSYPPSIPISVANTMAAARYAPNGPHTARSSAEIDYPRGSLEVQKSPLRTSTGHSQTKAPFESSSSAGSQNYMPQAPNPYQPLGQSPPVARYQATPPQTTYLPNATPSDSPQRSYVPQPLESYEPTPPPEQFQSTYVPSLVSEQSHLSYAPTPPLFPEVVHSLPEKPSFADYPTHQEETVSPTTAPDSSYTSSYEPPAQSYGYEPPTDSSYVPYVPDPDSESEDEKPSRQRKSIMDDDDEFTFGSQTKNPSIESRANVTPPPPSALTISSEELRAAEKARKEANDAAAEAAFRAAAEADAARDRPGSSSGANSAKTLKTKGSGWLGGISIWGGSKRDPAALDAAPASKGDKSGSSETKVHRAHLGEKNKIYYDPETKRWVNPDMPEASRPKATPPPPRALTPSMSMPAMGIGGSGMGGVQGVGPPSRVGTPADTPGSGNGAPTGIGLGAASGPPSGTGTPPLPQSSTIGKLNPDVGPQSRSSANMSNVSSIDDLLGAPGASSGRKTLKGKKGAKGARYIDVMAK